MFAPDALPRRFLSAKLRALQIGALDWPQGCETTRVAAGAERKRVLSAHKTLVDGNAVVSRGY